MSQYIYEPKADEHGNKIKHKWDLDKPGFFEDPNGHIEGKCPSDMNKAEAQNLLDTGLALNPEYWSKSHPKWFYNIFEGAVYKAVETNPGRSYHGFPCRGPQSRNGNEKPDMTAKMKKALLDLADKKGCRPQIEQWFKESP